MWVSLTAGTGAGGSLASRVGGLLDTAFKRRGRRKTSPPQVCGAGVLGPSETIVRAYLVLVYSSVSKLKLLKK